MSLTHTNAPARTSAAQISVPTPLPPPVTSARRPERSMSILTGSDFHDDGNHRGSAASPFVDDARERLTTVASHRLEIGGTFAGGHRDRFPHHLLGVLDEAFRLGRLHPAPRHDLRPGHDLAGDGVDSDHHNDDALLREHPPIPQHTVADISHNAVDVHVPGGYRAALDLRADVADRDGVAVFAD